MRLLGFLKKRRWVRRCVECRRRDEHLMEDGSWICHSCGHVEFAS